MRNFTPGSSLFETFENVFSIWSSLWVHHASQENCTWKKQSPTSSEIQKTHWSDRVKWEILPLVLRSWDVWKCVLNRSSLWVHHASQENCTWKKQSSKFCLLSSRMGRRWILLTNGVGQYVYRACWTVKFLKISVSSIVWITVTFEINRARIRANQRDPLAVYDIRAFLSALRATDWLKVSKFEFAPNSWTAVYDKSAFFFLLCAWIRETLEIRGSFRNLWNTWYGDKLRVYILANFWQTGQCGHLHIDLLKTSSWCFCRFVFTDP
jgi:hypothetical protein